MVMNIKMNVERFVVGKGKTFSNNLFLKRPTSSATVKFLATGFQASAKRGLSVFQQTARAAAFFSERFSVARKTRVGGEAE